ncbi:MAG: hypothetical protein IJ688_08315 [Treponema sp.]|nr:hypothetical protein [Treponema sp.]
MKSNCLFEAIKAKIKDPKNTRIIYIPKKINDGFHHFLWIKNNTVYHYEDFKNDKSIFFEGVIKTQSLESFEAMILRKKLSRYSPDEKKAFAKKMKFKSINEIGFNNWEIYCPEFDLNNAPKSTPIAKLVMVNTDLTINIIKIEEFDKNTSKICSWKYLSPYCDEWNTIDSSIR